MGTTYGLVVMLIMLILFVIALKWRKKIIQDTLKEFAEKPDSYTLVIHGDSTDALVDKIIVNAGDALSAFSRDDFAAENFTVQVRTKERSAVRNVTRAFPCDIDGNSLEEGDSGSASHFLLELETTGIDLERPFVKQIEATSKNCNLRLPAKLQGKTEVFRGSLDSLQDFKEAEEMQCKNKDFYEYSISHAKLPHPITLCNDWWWQAE